MSSTIGLFIPAGTEQKGNLHIDGNARIEGIFEGNLYCEDTFTLGVEGSFIGNLECMDAHIMGRFKGKIRVHNNCSIHKSARLEGLLDSQVAQIAKGSQIIGEVFISGHESK